MARKPLSKKIRFEVFRRDEFRCVYCGALPDDDELRIDHVMPVAAGGTNDPDNLATSCHDCNAGKGASVIPLRVGAETMEKLLRQLSVVAEVDGGARRRREEWISALCIPMECEAVLRWLSVYADAIDGVAEDLPWYSPRLHETIRGLTAVGLLEPDGGEPFSLSPRGTTRLRLRIRAEWLEQDGTIPNPRRLESWYADFPSVEDIYG